MQGHVVGLGQVVCQGVKKRARAVPLQTTTVRLTKCVPITISHVWSPAICQGARPPVGIPFLRCDTKAEREVTCPHSSAAQIAQLWGLFPAKGTVRSFPMERLGLCLLDRDRTRPWPLGPGVLQRLTGVLAS